MTGVLIKWENVDTHTHGEYHVKMGGSDKGHDSINQGFQGLPAPHRKLGERHGTDSPVALGYLVL